MNPFFWRHANVPGMMETFSQRVLIRLKNTLLELSTWSFAALLYISLLK
jgi:hypothetical protein